MTLFLRKEYILPIIFAFAILMQYAGTSKIIPSTAIYLLFVVVTFSFRYKHPINRTLLSYSYLILVFFVFLLASVLISDAKNYGSYKLFITSTFLMVSLAILICSPQTNFLYANLYAAVLIVILVFINYGSPLHLMEEATQFYRLGGEDDINPIILARGLGFSIITFLFFPTSRKWKIVLKYLLIVISFLYMVFSGSKGPIFALIIALGYTIWIRKKGQISLKKIVLWGASLLLVLWLLLISSHIFDDTFISYRFLDNQGSYNSRFDQYLLVINEIENFNIFEFFTGRGIGSYAILALNIDERAYPHNLTLELLYETGLVGVILFFSLVIYPFFQDKKLTSNGKYYLALTLFYLINSQFTGDLMANSLVFVFASMTVTNINNPLQYHAHYKNS